MKNKKINELNNSLESQSTVEEQVAFVRELFRRSKVRRQNLRKDIEALKSELGIKDADR